MGDWKMELDALVRQTTAFASSVSCNTGDHRSLPGEVIERVELKPLGFAGPEREEIIKRVQSFKAHQQRLIREREEYAASILLKALSKAR